MTLVLNGKGLLLEGSNPKIEDKQVPDRLSSQTTTPGASNMAMILARLDDVYASQKSLCDQLKRHWDLLREAVLHLKFGGVLQYILIILFMEEILHHLGSLQIIGKTTNLNWWTPDFWTINSITVIKVNSNVFFHCNSYRLCTVTFWDRTLNRYWCKIRVANVLPLLDFIKILVHAG